MKIPIKITANLKSKFDSVWKKHRIVFFSAPYGCGKTSACKVLLKRQKVASFSCAQDDIASMQIDENCNVVLIDDLQLIEPENQEVIYNLIKNREDLKFVLISDGHVPGWILGFSLIGIMHIFTINDLLIDKETMNVMLAKYNITLSEDEINEIHEEFCGYPLAINILFKHIIESGIYTESEKTRTLHDLFEYLDDVFCNLLDKQSQILLLSLAYFDSFNVELAKIITGDVNIVKKFMMINQKFSLFKDGTIENYSFWKIQHKLLRWKADMICSQEEKDAMYEKVAVYYETIGDIKNALDYYVKANNLQKVSNMLEKNAELDPSVGFYYEMEKYYFELPEQKILQSIIMMCAMSMLYSLRMDYETSDFWYDKLKEYLERDDISEEERHNAKNKLLYLDIALPQRGTSDIFEIMLNSADLISQNEVNVQTFSITSKLPSIMNGGKDFCEWSKVDDIIYPKIKEPLSTLVGHCSIGLAECGRCESKFEKGEDITDYILSLMATMVDVQTKGTLDIEFAIVGLLAREQIKNGKAEMALELLCTLKEKFLTLSGQRFVGNIDAFICRVNLYLGNTEKVKKWISEEAPKDNEIMRSMWRYIYITKAIAEINLGNPDKALLTVAPLIQYCEKCSRNMDKIHVHLIMAICYYRKNNAKWKDMLNVAVDLASYYNFIIPIAEYGVAILPLFKEYDRQIDEKYLENLVKYTRKYAVNYPRFLRYQKENIEKLSAAETQVLKLLCENLSNNEICEILDIKLSTTKTHVGRILQKMGVSSRNEVKDVAKKRHLI